jgi:uncharacterized membrane protein YphA (DoxX/SURF4 family)
MLMRSLVFVFAAMMPLIGDAHVKWFSKMANCVTSPSTPLDSMYSALFIGLGFAALAVMLVVTLIDWKISHPNGAVAYHAARVECHVTEHVSPLLRFGLAAYLVLIATYFYQSPIILTPDLKTGAAWVPIMQLLIAIMAMSRRTSWLASLGIVFLYAFAVISYGWFHLLDYQYFIGIAVFLAIDSHYGQAQGRLGLSILRVAVGISFLWVGVEKWMYPDWTYELLQQDLRGILMGFSPRFVVMVAGYVEFCLAFILIFGRLSSQVAPAVLLLLMVSAIPMVGMVDAIGHLPILIVLLLLTATRNRIGYFPRPGNPWHESGPVISFMVSVPGFIGAYYLSHELNYSGLHPTNWGASLTAVLLVATLVYRIRMTARKIFQHADKR